MIETPERNPIREAMFSKLRLRQMHNTSELTAYAKATSVVQYTANNYAQIYGFSKPMIPRVFAVVSLGGSLYGSLNNGILTRGDVQAYWTRCGIAPANHPTVVVESIDGASITPRANDGGATAENTLDVETIGACCPGSSNIIILYVAPITYTGFYNAFNAAINGSVVVNGRSVSPTIISCSWGMAERYWDSSYLSSFDALFATAVSKGINITAATGDSGSSNGAPGVNADFPSCSPNVIACGGTTLICPTRNYNAPGTREVAWPLGGGGISTTFAKPAFQAAIAGTKRHTPDVAMNADSRTGVQFLLNGRIVVYGGTSIVSPAMAAYIGCLPKSPGFVASLLYVNSKYFNDVLVGSNGAYSAKLGYDNCTGLGSPNGAALSGRL